MTTTQWVITVVCGVLVLVFVLALLSYVVRMFQEARPHRSKGRGAGKSKRKRRH